MAAETYGIVISIFGVALLIGLMYLCCKIKGKRAGCLDGAFSLC